MKTFFSIVYIPLNAALDEKVSIGLIMFDNENNQFRVSESKLQAIKSLIPVQNYTILKTYFKSLHKDINEALEEGSIKFDITNKKTAWVQESYMSYLHRYNNNLVSFSEVKSIDIPLNQENFKRIFEKYIFRYEEMIEDAETTFEQQVEIALFPKIEGKVNIQQTITPFEFEELITPVTVDFIGKNGIIVAGQTIDFSKHVYYLESDLNKYVTFATAANSKDKKDGKYFIIGREPDKIQIRKHQAWTYVKNNKLVEYIDFSETDKIREYIENKGVTPYFEKEPST
ncbi:hypothetical protein [Flavobacterium psychrotrophum]|uniref:hypothetical protein n=1 Tax=Flavobacterium psychrotrophum TaxID=2294119 RepID=UPI000E3190E9|nr:hypothetical protein [Flavobacterium psychrotrophum]